VVTKIISGGQTGADRAALNAAFALHIPHGGWCPKGRRAEDGPIDARFQLFETPSSDPAQRTEWNVRDADATLILSLSPILTGGSAATYEFARQHRKPCLHLSRTREGSEVMEQLRSFLEQHHVGILNVAGPRASEESEVAGFAYDTLMAALSPR
jgi:hypothetical protein